MVSVVDVPEFIWNQKPSCSLRSIKLYTFKKKYAEYRKFGLKAKFCSIFARRNKEMKISKRLAVADASELNLICSGNVFGSGTSLVREQVWFGNEFGKERV